MHVMYYRKIEVSQSNGVNQRLKTGVCVGRTWLKYIIHLYENTLLKPITVHNLFMPKPKNKHAENRLEKKQVVVDIEMTREWFPMENACFTSLIFQ